MRTLKRIRTDNQIFKVKLDGQIVDAELLTVCGLEDRDYAVYVVEDGTEYEILVSEVIKDDEGYDKLIDVRNREHFKIMSDYIKSLLEEE